jgi:hypothetical protein
LQRPASGELGGGEVDKVVALIEVAEQVEAIRVGVGVGKRGGRLRVGAGLEELDQHICRAFTAVVLAVAVRVDEDQVADAGAVRGGRGEADVDGEVVVVVVEVVFGMVEASFNAVVGGGLIGDDGDEVGADALRGGVIGWQRVLTDIVVAVFGEGQGHASGQTAAGLELAGWDMDTIAAAAEGTEEVVPSAPVFG